MIHRPIFAAALMAATPAVAQGVPFPVVDTGQTQCFDDRGAAPCSPPGRPFFGQDGQIQGRLPHYRDNGDGTVSDLVTGLMWQKSFERSGFAEAPAKAAASRIGGHGDWRVPTIKELYSLMDFSGATGSAMPSTTGAPADARPYLDRSVFAFEYPGQGRFIDAQYVSSTVYTGTTMGRDRSFFGVNFADGRIKAYPQNGGPGGRVWYARWVRGNPAYGRNDFADNGDGTVRDRATGLVWLQADSGAFRDHLGHTKMGDGRLDWAEALAFCIGLDFAGRRDWRLPNAKELHSMVDYGRSPQATASAALDPVFRITAITEADGSRNWPYFWTSTSHLDGRRPGDFAVYIAFGKAMGNMPAPPSGAIGGPPPGPMGPLGPTTLQDVHGAGAQRSSPKSGEESRLPVGAGPQGDVLRIYNYARCVR
jgi:hypothetical protein